MKKVMRFILSFVLVFALFTTATANVKAANSSYDTVLDFSSEIQDISEYNSVALRYNPTITALAAKFEYLVAAGENERINPSLIVPVKGGTAFYLEFGYRENYVKYMGEGEFEVKLLFSPDCVNWTDVTSTYIRNTGSNGKLSMVDKFDITALPVDVAYVKIEYPNNRDFRGYVTQKNYKVPFVSDDFCGIKKLCFNKGKGRRFEHEINYTDFFSSQGNATNVKINDSNRDLLGIDGFIANSLTIKKFDSEGRIVIDEDYIENNYKTEQPYIIYKIKPATAFKIIVKTDNKERLTCMLNSCLEFYVSQTGKDGSWTKLAGFGYSDLDNSKLTEYFIGDVGGKTNYIKVVFPISGDVTMNFPEKSNKRSGYDFFMVTKVMASLVNPPKFIAQTPSNSVTSTSSTCSTNSEHKFNAWKATSSASCIKSGTEERKCSRCNKIETRTIDALGHDFENPIITKEATISSTGIKKGDCKRCGKSVEEIIPCTAKNDALGITVETQEGVFVKGTELAFSKIESDNAFYKTVQKALKDFSEEFMVYDIAAIIKGMEVLPNGEVNLKIQLPEGYGADTELYLIVPDGTSEKIEATVDAQCETLSAKVTKFGTFAVCNVSKTQNVLGAAQIFSLKNILICSGLILIFAGAIITAVVIKKKKTSAK